jgi:glycogen(starch) synthase
MKVLFWTELFAPHIGGLEIYVGELVAELSRRGHSCGLITDAFARELPDQEFANGVTVFRLPMRTAIAQGNIRQLKQVTESASAIRHEFRSDIDSVFVSGPTFVVNRLSRPPHPVPIVANIQTDHQDNLRHGSLLRGFLGDCRKIVAVSDFVKRYLSSSAPELAGKLEHVANCLPPPALMPSPLPLDPPTILCLGRLVPDKGFDVALRAFARLDESLSGARMIMAGEGPDLHNLEKLCRNLRIDGRVEFLGRVEPRDVPALINRATMMVTPSRWQEASGGVNLEAAQMGRPVVATRVGGIPELVEHERTGLLVENENVDEMAEAISTLLRDPKRLIVMGEAGRRHALKRFSFDRYVDRYETLLADVVRDHR